MEWTQFLILIVSMGGMFLWNRSESNADRREAYSILKAIQDEIKAIQFEMKDFHNRLCKIEAERK